MFDHSKLKGLAKEKGETVVTLAKKLGITSATLSKKWNGKSSFSDVEIYVLCVYLGIDDPRPYFFTTKVY